MLNSKTKLVSFLERFFLVFLYINPIIDIFNGIYIIYIKKVNILDINFLPSLGVTPSLVLRMAFLCLLALYIILIKDKKSILTALGIGIAVALSVVSETIRTGSGDYFVDAQYAARFCFNIALMMAYSKTFSNKYDLTGKEKTRDYMIEIAGYTVSVLSISILICAIAGIGYSAYADRFGYRGVRGFFYAGNDITVVLMVLMPICCAGSLMACPKTDKKRFWLSVTAVSCGFCSLLLIGSKTAFVTAFLAILFPFVFSVFHNSKDNNYFKKFLVLLLVTALIFALLMITSKMALWDGIVKSFTTPDEMLQTEGLEIAMFSGRTTKLKTQLEMFKNAGILAWLFGLGRGSVENIIEMDIPEIFIYYGLVGGCAFIWLYIKAATDFLVKFFKTKKKDVLTVALFIGIGMTAGSSALAGHVMFSVTSGFYLIYAIVLSRVHFSEEDNKVFIWGK